MEKEREDLILSAEVDKEYVKFYEKLRNTVKKKLHKIEERFGKKGIEIILLAPDLFVLLIRLMKDSRVNPKNKIILGAVVAYWLLPTDLLPELLTGGIGYLDDMLITLYVLDTLFADTEIDVLLDNWPGNPEVISNLQTCAQKVKSLLVIFGGNIEKKVESFVEHFLKSARNKR